METIDLEPRIDQLVEPILRAGHITAADVQALRRDVFRDGRVARVEVELLFDLNDRCLHKDAAWNDFFVDTLTDFFVWKQNPSGYLSDDAARFLIERVTRDGRVDSVTELELVINICHWARHCPDDVIVLALTEVKSTVLGGGGILFGPERRRANVIDEADVEIIRRLVYASGAGGSLTITRREADLLFDLNDATIQRENAASWRELFVTTIASHLMFPRGAPQAPSADEARRREAWLSDRRGVGQVLRGMASSLGHGGFKERWKAADLFGTHAKREQEERLRAQQSEAEVREAIDEAEAAWLLQRIDKDGILHDNERALLAFIKERSPNIHPSLQLLFDKMEQG